MLRSNGNRGEIRTSDRVSISYCTVNSTKARRRSGYVSSVPSRSTRLIFSGREKQSNITDICRRCRVSTSTVLDAISAYDQMPYRSSASDGSNFDRRSWRNDKCLDQAQTKAGAAWVTKPRFSGATGTTGRTPVHDARTGTTRQRTRTTTSRRAVSVSARIYRFANAMALQADLSMCGQPLLSSFGEYVQRFGRTLSRKSKGEADIPMGKRHYRLIDKIVTIDNLRAAYKKTARGKKMTWGYLEFKEYNEANLLRIRDELVDGGYRIGKYREFTIYEPKARLISALDFKDRLVQHAVCNIIGPIFDKALLPQTFACRVGMGTHAGVRYVQSQLRATKARYFLKTDFSKFFPSIDRGILHDKIERKIGCEATLNILREIVPPQGKGLPIGSLTSQIFANVYGDFVDRHIHFDLGLRQWARYMDDIVVLGDDLPNLRDAHESIALFSDIHMALRISKWHANPVSRGVNFLGYRIWPTHKLLRKDSVIRAKRKIESFIQCGETSALSRFLASWSGHARWADTHNLVQWLESKHGISFETNH